MCLLNHHVMKIHVKESRGKGSDVMYVIFMSYVTPWRSSLKLLSAAQCPSWTASSCVCLPASGRHSGTPDPQQPGHHLHLQPGHPYRPVISQTPTIMKSHAAMTFDPMSSHAMCVFLDGKLGLRSGSAGQCEYCPITARLVDFLL